jgi:hypothetical protein
VDPTAVIPPHRVEKSNAHSPYLLAGFAPWDSAVFSHIGDWMDNLSYRWYGFLANVLQARNQNWSSWFFNNKHYVLVTLLLILSMWLVWRLLTRESPVTDDPVLRMYDNFCRKLNRRGLERLAYENASDYAARVCMKRPDLETSVQSITHLYNQLRYGKQPCQAAYKQLCREIARFRT